MNGFHLDPATKVIVQGATGRMGSRHAELMKQYGTNVVGGIAGASARRGNSDIPLFGTCHEAVAATDAEASITLVPPMDVLSAVTEALKAGLKLIVSPSEGMPVRDAMIACARVKEHGAVWIGPSTPGLAIPNKMKLGFIPDVSLLPGPYGRDVEKRDALLRDLFPSCQPRHRPVGMDRCRRRRGKRHALRRTAALLP